MKQVRSFLQVDFATNVHNKIFQSFTDPPSREEIIKELNVQKCVLTFVADICNLKKRAAAEICFHYRKMHFLRALLEKKYFMDRWSAKSHQDPVENETQAKQQSLEEDHEEALQSHLNLLEEQEKEQDRSLRNFMEQMDLALSNNDDAVPEVIPENEPIFGTSHDPRNLPACFIIN